MTVSILCHFLVAYRKWSFYFCEGIYAQTIWNSLMLRLRRMLKPILPHLFRTAIILQFTNKHIFDLKSKCTSEQSQKLMEFPRYWNNFQFMQYAIFFKSYSWLKNYRWMPETPTVGATWYFRPIASSHVPCSPTSNGNTFPLSWEYIEREFVIWRNFLIINAR